MQIVKWLVSYGVNTIFYAKYVFVMVFDFENIRSTLWVSGLRSTLWVSGLWYDSMSNVVCSALLCSVRHFLSELTRTGKIISNCQEVLNFQELYTTLYTFIP